MTKAGMGGAAPATRQVTEKRSGEREPASVEVTVRGKSDSYAAQTVDVSRSGALLWITDEKFLTGADATSMVPFSERVAQELGTGMVLEFPGGCARAADVVRVTRKGREDTNPMLVACRFEEPIQEGEWAAMGLDPTQTSVQSDRIPAIGVPELRVHEPPDGVDERRAYPRIERVLYVEVHGDYGTYRAYALNVSLSGILLTIADPQFAPPAEPDQLVRFTKRLGFQFRNGMIVRFIEAEFRVEAEVVRVSERIEGGELFIVIGARFRRMLSKEEAAKLDITPSEPPAAPAAEVPAAGPAPEAPPASAANTRILDLMREAIRLHASDLHVKVGAPARMRVAGELLEVGKAIILPEEAHAMALEVMTPALAQRFHQDNDIDFAYTIEGLGRFRISAFRQRGYTGLAIRTIPEHIPSFDELGVHPVARTLADRPRGLVLVTGATGSGKSHTLAAMIQHINETRACHILTMEDPIEFVHPDVRAHITQREIGRDCPGFAEALKRGLRMDPDVILVGEMRDLETISLALTAAETGHLVLATLHTTSAVSTPDRIIDVFPPNQQMQVRQQLSETLRGIISQLLVPRVDGGVALAQEVLVVNDAIRALIREGKTTQILNIMQTASKDGMKTLETSLNEMVQAGAISYEVAVAKANIPKMIQPPGERRMPRPPR